MNKSILILHALLFFAVAAFAQVNVDLKVGEEYSASKRSTLAVVIGYDETGFYVLSTKGYFMNQLSVDHFDNQLKKTKSQEVELETEGKERNFEFVVHSNNKLFLFSSFANQKLKKKFLFVQTVNKQTLIPDKDLKKIAEVDYDSKYNSGNYNFRISRKKDKILVFYNLPYVKNEAEKFGFHVFDTDMNQIWTKSITLPYIDKLFNVN